MYIESAFLVLYGFHVRVAFVCVFSTFIKICYFFQNKPDDVAEAIESQKYPTVKAYILII